MNEVRRGSQRNLSRFWLGVAIALAVLALIAVLDALAASRASLPPNAT